MKNQGRVCCGLVCRCAAAAQKRHKGRTPKFLLFLLKMQTYYYFWWISLEYIFRKRHEVAKIIGERPSILKPGRPDSKHLLYDLKKTYRSTSGMAPLAMMLLYTLSRSCPVEAYPIIQERLNFIPPSKSFISKVGHCVILIIYRAFLQKAQKERLNENQFAQFVTELESL